MSPVNQTAASVTIAASKTIIRLKPSSPTAKLSRQSAEIVKELTCWKPPCHRSNKAKASNVMTNVDPDASSAVFRGGAPAMIKMAATIGQKTMNRSIKFEELFAQETH